MFHRDAHFRGPPWVDGIERDGLLTVGECGMSQLGGAAGQRLDGATERKIVWSPSTALLQHPTRRSVYDEAGRKPTPCRARRLHLSDPPQMTGFNAA